MKPINVGLIGNGKAAQVFHIPVIQSVPDLRLLKVVDRHGSKSPSSFEYVPDAAAILSDDKIELIVIATPNTSHFDLAKQALLAGKHVVVDKPFTLSSIDAQQLIDLSHRNNRILSVFQNRRWDGDFLTVRRLLEENVLGNIVEYESRFERYRPQPRPGSWREVAGEGSGLLWDIGPHLIDQALVLFGKPNTVIADVQTQRKGASADDYFKLTLQYDTFKAILSAGMLVREPGPRFLVRGVSASFVKYGLDPQEEALKNGGSPLDENWGREPKEFWGTLSTQNGSLVDNTDLVETVAGCYQAFYQNIADAIMGRAGLIVKPEHALDTIRIIEYHSKQG